MPLAEKQKPLERALAVGNKGIMMLSLHGIPYSPNFMKLDATFFQVAIPSSLFCLMFINVL